MMEKGRLEAFSDGVFAIIITIMVLDLKIPSDGNWTAIMNDAWMSTFLAYLVSFIITASFWVSHHLIISNLKKVDSGLLWINVLTLLPMSLVPITTAWFGEFPNSVAPSVTYGLVYVLSVGALFNLSHIVSKHLANPVVQKRMRRVNRSRIGLIAIGLVGTGLAFIWPPVTGGMVLVVSGVWLFLRAVVHVRALEDL
ncbi:TMEM175 family protein [Weissella cibaria]|uniref:TMEM175 family protein n=1 Tax=Weissella cibaria TaxID=137591 RepID=UPI0020A711AA|nr:TMEM175 family protein [Weissella cibaria]MCV3316752.1 TMEM175 family protein [Weissella cibaria]